MSVEPGKLDKLSDQNVAIPALGIVAGDPTAPSGHAYGIDVATRLTSYYRQAHRKHSENVTPRQVMDCLIRSGVKNWVLMGLHGYVGYLPMPRATQGVDVMVPYSQRKKAKRALSEQWPTLNVSESEALIRFSDPKDLDADGHAKPVIDIMLPHAPFQESVLEKHVLTDQDTGDRIPTIEAAIVSKYAALVSPNRSIDRKEYDAGDFRRLVKANKEKIDFESLRELASLVHEKAKTEIVQLIDQAINDQRFTI